MTSRPPSQPAPSPRRGEVHLLRLDSSEGSEQTGTRPAVVVSRNALNRASPVVVVCPLIDASRVSRLYPSAVRVSAPQGGLTKDSIC